MSKRPATVVAAFVILLIGAAALAQKNASTTIKLIRLEGKSQEFLLEATAVAMGAVASWQPAADSNGNGDGPALEYTAGDPKTLSFDLAFDTFESKDSVHDKFVRPIEDLTAVDPSLDRPPMVQVVWSSNSFPAFKGVVGSVSTKYTMFMPDGTPVRCTTTVTMKKASRASKKKPPNPCP